MSRAVLLALVTTVTWGIWAALAKVATRTVAPSVVVVLSFAASAAVGLAYVAVRPVPVTTPGEGALIAIVSGVFAGVGSLAFYEALSSGRTAIVTTVTALYFVVAAVIGVVAFGEALGARDAAGIGLAVVAVALLAS